MREGMVPLAETASLGLAPIQAVLSRTGKETWGASSISEPTLRMAQQVQRDAMGPHLQGEADDPPHGGTHSALDQ